MLKAGLRLPKLSLFWCVSLICSVRFFQLMAILQTRVNGTRRVTGLMRLYGFTSSRWDSNVTNEKQSEVKRMSSMMVTVMLFMPVFWCWLNLWRRCCNADDYDDDSNRVSVPFLKNVIRWWGYITADQNFDSSQYIHQRSMAHVGVLLTSGTSERTSWKLVIRLKPPLTILSSLFFSLIIARQSS